jgi:hypothetical protein
VVDNGDMSRRPRLTWPWVTVAWVAATVAAVVVTVGAVLVAGSKVTTRPMPSVSSDRVEAALVGNAASLSNESAGAGTGETVVSETGHGGNAGDGHAGPSLSAGGADDHGGSAAPSGSGGEHPSVPSSPSATVDDHPVSTTTSEADSPTTTSTPKVAVYSKVFQAGTVQVQCRGNDVSLLGATVKSPATFRWELSIGGPDELEGTFRSDAIDYEVRAHCSAGNVIWT